MMTRFTRRFGALWVAGFLILAGCDDSPTDPPDTPGVAEIQVTPDEITFTVIGLSEAFSAIVLDEDGEVIDDATVAWSSSNEEVATVNEVGVVQAVGEGSATIAATSGDVTGEAQVNVQIPEDAQLSPDQATLTAIDETVFLELTVFDSSGNEIEGVEASWTTSDGGVATVPDGDGVVVATGEGTATITATVGEDISVAAEITVEIDDDNDNDD